MNYKFLVLIDSISAGEYALSPSVPPTVYVNGIAADIFTDIDTVTVVGTVKPLRVRQGVRGRTRGRHADLRCSACAAPKDKAHHTEDTGQS